MSQKTSIPKGTRDFLPDDVKKRQFIFDTIKDTYRLHGYLPIETPSFELTSTLLGKYGEEGDRLIFKILNSGEKVKKADIDALANDNLAKFSNSISEKALRYDLTVPFARFVVQHQNEITFPFKRYQIQPVWRADRPQHGRYQEFFQCDGDVVGSDSLWHEVDLIQIIDEVLFKLKFPGYTIKLNNRKILEGIAEICGQKDRIIDITVALDKLDKIGDDGVLKELEDKGFDSKTRGLIHPLFQMSGNWNERFSFMQSFLLNSEIGTKGMIELGFIHDCLSLNPMLRGAIEFDVTLARGLNYYTGTIIEVKADDVQMGSICGGGRYDDLTGLFGLKGVSGVGISFGADRIYDCMESLKLFPSNITDSLDVLFLNFGKEEIKVCHKLSMEIRNKGLISEIYPTDTKLQKQMKYANDRGAKTVVLLGEKEIANHTVVLKNMESGVQEEVNMKDFLNYF